MKKYLTIVAFLAAIAIVGVSFLAQAAPETAAVTTTIEKSSEVTTMPAPDATNDKMMAPAAADQLAKDTAECTALASAPKTDGATVTDAEKADALKKCMADKGHTDAAPATAEGAKEGDNKAADVKTEEHH